MLALSLEGVRSTTTPASSPSLSCYPHLSSLNPVRLDPTSPAPGACPDRNGAMKFLPFALATSHSSLATKSFRIRTSAECACNSCRIRTSKTQDLKPFRMNTSKKTGVGEGGEQKYDEVFLSRATGRSEGTLRSALHRSRDTDYGELPPTHDPQFSIHFFPSGNSRGSAGGVSAMASNSGNCCRSGSGTFTLEPFKMLISCSALTTPFP